MIDLSSLFFYFEFKFTVLTNFMMGAFSYCLGILLAEQNREIIF